ncbi:MAG: TIR domain-containing protein [Ilumatobacter sp.]
MERFEVFLSHSSTSSELVSDVATELRRIGMNPWLDVEQLASSDPLMEGLDNGLRQCGACAVFLDGAEPPQGRAKAEIEVALNRAASDGDFRIFAVLLPGVPAGFDSTRFPSFLMSHVWVDVRFVDRREGASRIARAVRGEPQTEAHRAVAESEANPYVGLRPFGPESADVFWGRTADVQKMVESLGTEPFLAVLGASGSGKSSVLRAGLVPEMAASTGATAVRLDDVVTLTPGAQPLRSLASAVVRFDATRGVDEVHRSLLEDPATLGVISGDRALWVIDQFEEVFTQATADAARDAFVANLVEASRPGGGARVAIALRSDFLPVVANEIDLGQRVAAHQHLIQPLAGHQLREAVERPAWARGGSFEPGLVDRILNEAEQSPARLPLVQHALRELWDDSSSEMTHESYDRIGGISGSLAQRADETYLGLDPDAQVVARDLLLRMVQLGDDGPDTKRPARIPETARGAEASIATRAVEALAAARLVTADGDVVELSHEALLSAWPRLSEWIDQSRADIRERDRVEYAAGEWEAARNAGADNEDDYLWHGSRVETAAEWAARTGTELSPVGGEFLRRSSSAHRTTLEAEASARRFRLRAAVAASLGMSVLAGTAFGLFLEGRSETNRANDLAVIAAEERDRANDESDRAAESAELAVERADEAQRNADRSLALQLAAESVVLRDDNPALAVALAAASVELTDEARPEALRALTGARLAFGQRLGQAIGARLTGHENRVWAIAVSPDGSLIASGSDDTTIRLWDASSGEQVGAPLVGHTDSVRSVAFSPDGAIMASAGRDFSVRLWDVAAGEQLGDPLVGHAEEVRTVAFHPSEPVLAVGSADDGITVWDLESLDTIAEIPDAHQDDVWMLRFDPGGDTLTSASADGTVGFWSTDDWSPDGDVLLGSEDQLRDVAYSPDGEMLATVGRDFLVRRWDVASRTQIGEAMAGHESAVLGVAFSPDGDVIASVSDDGTLRFWDAATGEVLGDPLRSHTDAVRGVAYTAGGSLLVTGSSDQTIQRWDPSAGDPLGRAVDGHDDRVLGVAASNDGAVVATASRDATVRLWDPATGAPLGEPLVGHEGAVLDVSISPDGGSVASVGADATLRVWSVSTGELVLAVPDAGNDQLNAVEYSPNGEHIATGGVDTVAKIWDAATGELLVELAGHTEQISSIAYSADGLKLATGAADELAIIWNAETGAQIGDPLVGHTAAVFGLAFDTSGDRLATSGNDRTVRLWDTANGEQLIEPMRGHRARAWGLAFVADDQYLVSTGLDGTVRLFDPVAGLAVGDPLTDHDDRVVDVAPLPGSVDFATVSWDGTLRIWSDVLDPSTACAAVELYVTQEQTSQFVPEGRTLQACR